MTSCFSHIEGGISLHFADIFFGFAKNSMWGSVCSHIHDHSLRYIDPRSRQDCFLAQLSLKTHPLKTWWCQSCGRLQIDVLSSECNILLGTYSSAFSCQLLPFFLKREENCPCRLLCSARPLNSFASIDARRLVDKNFLFCYSCTKWLCPSGERRHFQNMLSLEKNSPSNCSYRLDLTRAPNSNVCPAYSVENDAGWRGFFSMQQNWLTRWNDLLCLFSSPRPSLFFE
jgi:hypothetical protein